jgi:transcriptional regulator
MYVPKHFAEESPEALHAFVAAHPLGALVTQGPDGLDANHLPFLLDPAKGQHGHLLAHVARANPIWTEVKDGDAVLVIFRGEEAYISPNWYPSKHEAHRQVPTWNYQVVHAHGRIIIRDNEPFVRGVVAKLTRIHEASTGSASPWKMGDAPTDYLDQMLAAIVGIEIEITRIVGKSKLSQNREARDRSNVAAELDKRGESALAGAMRKTPLGDK